MGGSVVGKPGRLTVKTDLVGPIAIEVTDEGLVAGVAEKVCLICGAETALVSSEFVGDVDLALG